MRQTHTYATLEISASAYDEIRQALEAVGYQHAIHDGLIDMHGIAVSRREEPAPRVDVPVPLESSSADQRTVGGAYDDGAFTVLW